MNRSKGLITGLISLLFLLSACGTITLELEQDGSGQVRMEVPSNGMVSATDIKYELESELSEKEGVGGFSVKDKGEMIEASFKFDDISSVDPSSYQIPVADYVILDDSRLESLEMVEEITEFAEDSSEIFVKLPSDLNDFDEARVILSGNVVAHSEDIELIDKNIIEISSYGEAYVVYEPKANLGVFAWGLVILIPVAGGVFYYRRQKNSENPQAMNEVDVHA